MRSRDFNNELIHFLEKIKKREHFSLSRWGDGELMILENQFIDLRNVKNGEFCYDPSEKKYEKSRDLLNRAYTYRDSGYYVGIACRCCVGYEKFKYMIEKSGQPDENLTWANIFVNANYNKFLELYIPEFSNKKIIMVVNDKANTDLLTFNVEKTFYVGTDAWFENLNIIDKLKKVIEEENVTDTIFLISAGPLADILAHQLWDFSKRNTYIDIGSVFDTLMGMKPTRGYLKGHATLNKTCIW